MSAVAALWLALQASPALASADAADAELLSRLPRPSAPAPDPHRRTLDLAFCALSAGASAYILHTRADAAYARYMAAGGDFDRGWSAVLRWELARDSAAFLSAAFAVGAFVTATAGRNPGVGALFSAAPVRGGAVALVRVPFGPAG